MVSSAEHHVLPLIWVDEQVQPDTAVDVLAAAHSVLLGERASRRLLLLEALSDILAAGVDEESALRALRLLPVTSVRISAKTRGTDTLLVDWADDGPDRTASGGDVQVHVDVGAGPTPGDPPSGALELTCTRALTEDENDYAQNLVALLRLWLPTRPRADGAPPTNYRTTCSTRSSAPISRHGRPRSGAPGDWVSSLLGDRWCWWWNRSVTA